MPVPRTERRSFPRPPLWLNLLILLLGIAGMLVARQHRARVAQRYANVIAEEQRVPHDVKRMKEELAEVDLNRDQLQRELDGRMKFLGGLKSEDFYLSVDTTRRKIRFYYGNAMLREEDVAIGGSKNIVANGKSWSFVPVKGAFPVQAKLVHVDWRVPEWLGSQSGEVIPNGLGAYVIEIGNGYVIHSPPSEQSPLHGPKPGSFMVSEDFLRAVWPRVERNTTTVYIY